MAEKSNSKEQSLLRSLCALVIPIALQSLISAAVNAADVMMLGSVSQEVMSSVSIAGQITFVLQLFFLGLSGGLSILAAQYWGKGDPGAVERILAIATGLSFGVSLLFFAASEAVPELLLRIFTNDPALIGLGKIYLRALAPSYLLMSVSQMFLALMKNTGRASRSTYISASSLICNIILNAVCIFILFPGNPQAVAAGVAVSTCAARLLELVWSAAVTAKSPVRLKKAHLLHPDKTLFSDYGQKTAPMQLNYIIWGGGVAAVSAIMGHLSSDLVAANAILSTVRNLAIVVCSGIAGGSILVGQQLGRNDLENARTTGKLLCICALVFGALAGGTMLLARPLVFHFTSLSETASGYLRQMFYVSAVYCIGKSFNSTVVGGIFCAGGDTKFGMFCDLITMWVVIIPLGLLTAFVLKWEPVAVFLVLSLDEFVKIPAVVHHYRKGHWLKNLTRDSAAAEEE